MTADTGLRVAVTGATGYVGREVVHAFAGAGAQVLALGRRAGPAPSPGEGVRRVVVDLLAPATLEGALQGVDVVVHAARSSAGTAELRAGDDVAMVRALLAACERAGVRRLVHLSTISVYERPPDGIVDEEGAWVAAQEPYAASKVTIERELLAARGRCEVVILQPGNVVGGAGGWWSGAVLDLMRRGCVLVPDHGRGAANLVHVRDVARACVAAGAAPGLAGERMLLVDEAHVTWREFYEGLERRLGRPAAIYASADECLRLSRRASDRRVVARALRWAGRRLLGRPIVFPLSEEAVVKYASRARFSATKATRALEVRLVEVRADGW